MGTIICFIFALGIALIVVGILKSQLKSVEVKTQADTYVTKEALELTLREDHYTHTTRERRHDPLDDGDDD